MGQKVRPTGFRTGIMIDWQSQWYASKKEFGELLVEDFKIRRFIRQKHAGGGVAKIRIERTREKVVVYIHSGRVGSIIGKKGEKIDKLTKQLEHLVHRVIEIKTVEVNRPEVEAQLVAQDIGEQLERREFRRTMKNARGAMENGAMDQGTACRAGWGAEMPVMKAMEAVSRCQRCGRRSITVHEAATGAGQYRHQGVGQ